MALHIVDVHPHDGLSLFHLSFLLQDLKALSVQPHCVNADVEEHLNALLCLEAHRMLCGEHEADLAVRRGADGR